MKLTINSDITDKVNNFSVIAYTMKVDNTKTSEVDEYFNEILSSYHNKYKLEEVVNIPKLKVSRDGYKLLGKDPSHTRLACEALLRRVIKGVGLYRLGDIIDLGNLLSLQTLRSVCVVDADKIKGDVIIRKGTSHDFFFAINRGQLNIENIPVYCDEKGMFGTPTSDTMRTMVDENTSNILIMIIMFDTDDYEKDELLLKTLYQKYTKATNLRKIEVQYGK